MVIYIDKKGSQLDVDEVITGTAFAFNASNWIDGTFLKSTTWQRYFFPIGVTLTESDSFTCRVDFTTSSPFTYTNTPSAYFGLGNNSMVNPNPHRKNTLAGIYKYNGTGTGLECFNGSAAELARDVDATVLSAGTDYYIILTHDTTNGDVTMVLYTAADVVVSSYSGNIGAGVLVITHVGAWSISSGTGAWDNNWKITAVKVNSGIVEETAVLEDVVTDNVLIATTIKQPGEFTWTDISTSVANISIHRRINTATILKMKLMNARDFVSAKLSPNTKIRITLGVSYTTGHFLFWGYIPIRKDYTNKVSIKGKDITYKEPNMITFNGVAHDIIDPASAEFLEGDERESSEQEDIFKAQKHILKNSEVLNAFDADDQWVNITAYDFIGKLTQEYLMFDEVTNVNNMEVFAGLAIVINNMEESDLAFGGGGSSPKKYIGDSKTDWKKFKDFIDEQMKRLEDDSNLGVENKKYYYYQSNHGTPTFVIKEWPNVLVDPVIIKTIEENEILKVNKGRRKQIEVTIQKALHLDIGDVVYINTDKFKLRGTYFLPELVHNYSATDCTTKLVLSEPGLIR